jgi:hypothetical protein
LTAVPPFNNLVPSIFLAKNEQTFYYYFCYEAKNNIYLNVYLNVSFLRRDVLAPKIAHSEIKGERILEFSEKLEKELENVQATRKQHRPFRCGRFFKN